MTDQLLKGDQVAKILNISRTQAFILMQRGIIPTVRFGKIVRVRVEDLEHFIEEKCNAKGTSQNKSIPAAVNSGYDASESQPRSK